MNMPNPEKLADSTTLQVLSRLSMLATPVLLSVAILIGREWITDMRADIDAVQTELPQAKERIRVLETTIDRGRADREAFQRQTTVKLEQISDILTTIVKEQSALRATVEAQQRQIDRGGR